MPSARAWGWRAVHNSNARAGRESGAGAKEREGREGARRRAARYCALVFSSPCTRSTNRPGLNGFVM